MKVQLRFNGLYRPNSATPELRGSTPAWPRTSRATSTGRSRPTGRSCALAPEHAAALNLLGTGLLQLGRAGGGRRVSRARGAQAARRTPSCSPISRRPISRCERHADAAEAFRKASRLAPGRSAFSAWAWPRRSRCRASSPKPKRCCSGSRRAFPTSAARLVQPRQRAARPEAAGRSDRGLRQSARARSRLRRRAQQPRQRAAFARSASPKRKAHYRACLAASRPTICDRALQPRVGA